ncbi:MAG: hypothetical protein ACJA1B_003067 [Polaribacter sp.]|jgi:hypothetical protein
MKTNTLKQIAILLICAVGLYFSGSNLLNISSIKSLSDAATVMTFFSCFFPFSILTINLSINLLQTFIKLNPLQL